MTSRIEEQISKKRSKVKHCFSPSAERQYWGHPSNSLWSETQDDTAIPEGAVIVRVSDAIAVLHDAKLAIAKIASTPARIDAIDARVLSLEKRRPTILTTIVKSLACGDIEVIRSIPVTIEAEVDGGFIASFFDAGISSGGETIQEAIESLQDFVATSFRTLEKLADVNLGPKMLRQKLVLTEFLCRRSLKLTQKSSPKS